MNLQQLRYVIATAERGTMTAAAEALHVAQPALSRAIRALEQELGITVFARQGRGLRLTEDGQELVDLATRVMADVQRITRLGETAALPVCATGGQARELGVMAVARQVNGRGGRVHLNVTDSRDDVFEAVRNGSARLGLVDLPAPRDLREIPLGLQECMLVYPPDWKLKGPLGVADLEGLPLLFWPPGDWRRELLDEVLESEGVEPVVSVETTERDLITRFVIQGAGATLMFGCQKAALEAGAQLAGFDPPVVRRVGVVSTSKPTGDAAAFVDQMRRETATVLLAEDDPHLAGALLVSGKRLRPLVRG